jgi:hypothetical protein
MAMPSASLVPNSDDTSPRASSVTGPARVESRSRWSRASSSSIRAAGWRRSRSSASLSWTRSPWPTRSAILCVFGDEEGTSIGYPHRHETLIVWISGQRTTYRDRPPRAIVSGTTDPRHPGVRRIVKSAGGRRPDDLPTLAERRLGGATVPPAQSGITAVVAPATHNLPLGIPPEVMMAAWSGPHPTCHCLRSLSLAMTGQSLKVSWPGIVPCCDASVPG